jgi:hypothetical protein
MAKSVDVYTFEWLIYKVEELWGVRFEVIGRGKERKLWIPAEPNHYFPARGRRECVRYLQGMIWAGLKNTSNNTCGG